MDVMGLRRSLLMRQFSSGIDTSPLIAEYGKACAFSATGERDLTDGCLTEWYLFNPQQTGKLTIHNYCKNTSYRIYNYQYSNQDATFVDWYYETGSGRLIGREGETRTLYRIRFTLDVATIDDCYAYCSETGQIFFAGRNSIYYGYTNLNQMPT